MAARFFFGVDVGATFTKVALLDQKSGIVCNRSIPSKGFSSKRLFAENIKDVFDDILSGCRLKASQIKCLGIGLPGPVDFDRGVVLSLTNIKGWNHFKLVSYLKRFFPFPVFIENDANCMAFAESRMGAARGASFVLCITLGTGVGGGLILDGEIYRGPFYSACEIGHIPMALSGQRCGCGGFACLERFVGNRAIERIAKKEFKKDISLEELSRLAKRGNSRASKIWDGVGQQIGLAISGVVNIFNPQIVVVGGGVSAAGDCLLRPIRRTVRRHAMSYLKSRVKVKRATLGNEAGVLGAALLAKERVEASV